MKASFAVVFLALFQAIQIHAIVTCMSDACGVGPTRKPTKHPTSKPTSRPTPKPTKFPTKKPTSSPTLFPTFSRCVNGIEDEKSENCIKNSCKPMWLHEEFQDFLYHGENCDQIQQVVKGDSFHQKLIKRHEARKQSFERCGCGVYTESGCRSSEAELVNAFTGDVIMLAELVQAQDATEVLSFYQTMLRRCLVEEPNAELIASRDKVAFIFAKAARFGLSYDLGFATKAMINTHILANDFGQTGAKWEICQDLCPCGQYTSTKEAIYCSSTHGSVESALEHYRYMISHCQSNGVFDGIPGLFLSRALFCARALALDGENGEKSRSVLRELSFVLDKAVQTEWTSNDFLLEQATILGNEIAILDNEDMHSAARQDEQNTNGKLPMLSPRSLQVEVVDLLVQRYNDLADNLKEISSTEFIVDATASNAKTLDAIFKDGAKSMMENFLATSTGIVGNLELESGLVRTVIADKLGSIASTLKGVKTQHAMMTNLIQQVYDQAVQVAEQANLVEELRHSLEKKMLWMSFATSLLSGFLTGGASIVGILKAFGGDSSLETSLSFFSTIGDVIDVAGTIKEGLGEISNLDQDAHLVPNSDSEEALVTLFVEMNDTIRVVVKRMLKTLELLNGNTGATLANVDSNDVTLILDALNVTIEAGKELPAQPSSAVWSEFYRNFIGLLMFEYNICPRPITASGYESVANRKGESSLFDGFHRRLQSSGKFSNLRRSLATKEELAEEKQELKTMLSTLESLCANLDRTVESWMGHADSFQLATESILAAVRDIMLIDGRLEKAKETEQNWKEALLRLANSPDLKKVTDQSRRISEANRAVMETEVIKLERMAIHNLEALCEAYRYRNPEWANGASSPTTQIRGVFVNHATCQVSLQASGSGLQAKVETRVQRLKTAIEGFSSLWRTKALKDDATTETYVSDETCSIVEPDFFESLFSSNGGSAEFEVNFESFKGFCRGNTELVRIYMVFFDEDNQPLPSPGSEVEPVLHIDAVKSFQKATFDQTKQALRVQEFVPVRDFSFDIGYKVLKENQICVGNGDTIGFKNGDVRVCDKFRQTSQEFFLRSTPYSTWRVHLDTPQNWKKSVGKIPTRAEVIFKLVFDDLPDKACINDANGLTAMNFGLPLNNTERAIVSSIGSTCQWRISRSMRSNIGETTANGENENTGSPEEKPVILIPIGIAMGVISLVVLSGIVVYLRRNPSTSSESVGAFARPENSVSSLNPRYGDVKFM